VVVLHLFKVNPRGLAVFFGAGALCVAAPSFAQGPAAPAPPAAPAAVNDAAAQDPQAALRAQIELLRQQLEALQQKVAALEAGGGQRPAEPAAAVPPPQTPPPPAPAPVYGNTSALSKVFNPDMAVIGNFVGAAGRNTIAPIPALRLNEAEMSFQAIVDPYARADFFLAASPEGLEVEEGFITFPTLPGGVLMKVGKMKAQFGKVNTMHSHTLPWVDEPLPMTNLLGGDEGLNDSGISVSKLIMNPFLFLEATGEVYQGDDDLFTSYKRGNLAYVGRLRGYRDVTEDINLDLGTSVAYGHNDAGPDFTTRVFGIDATLRYRPLQQALYKKILVRTELFWSRREQPVADAKAFGAYVSGEYQLTRRLFGGVRFDTSERATDASLKDTSGSLLLTFWPSEFSQVRGQYRRTRYAEAVTANEFLFQFLFSIGAHGAHVF
jgi:hypothetical protein